MDHGSLPRKKAEGWWMDLEGKPKGHCLLQRSGTVTQFLIYRCSPSVCTWDPPLSLILQSMQYFSVSGWNLQSPDSLHFLSSRFQGMKTSLGWALTIPAWLLSPLTRPLPPLCLGTTLLPSSFSSSMNPWITVCIRHLTEVGKAVGSYASSVRNNVNHFEHFS